jgi:hypothetical protein
MPLSPDEQKSNESHLGDVSSVKDGTITSARLSVLVEVSPELEETRG